jgi:outer membrane usher protein
VSSTDRFLFLVNRDHCGAAIMEFGCATIIMLIFAILPRLATAAEQILLLEVNVNGHSIGKIGEFTLHNGVLAARRDELRNLGFQVPDPIAFEDSGLISLSDLPGLTWRLDQTSQTLFVSAADDRLLPAILQVGRHSNSGGTLENGTGATLDYDVNRTSTGGKSIVSGLLNLRAFSPLGTVSSGLLTHAGGSPGGLGAKSAIRLDSTYTLSDPDTLRRYSLGDFITGALNWIRPVRLGGVQLISDFSMRPDLVTFPLPSVSGSAAVPSTVDVLVNGLKLFSHQVEAGPFQIPQLPVVTGAGTISMMLTNALGQQTLTELPFLASSALLAPGLQTFSAQAGAVRRNWGLISNDYGDFAAIANYRRGLSPTLTVEGSAEGSAGTFMAGGGFVMNADDVAVFNVAAAASTSGGHSGMQFSAGVQRLSTVFSFGTAVSMASDDFRDVAAMNGAPISRLRLNASAGLSLGRFGSVGVAYAGIDSYTARSLGKLYITPGSAQAESASLGGGVYLPSDQHTHVLSASYSVSLHNMSMYVTGFHDFASSKSSGLLVGLTIPLGERSSVSASLGSGTGGSNKQVQAAQTPVTIGDWGYQLYDADGRSNHEFAQLQYKSPWTLLTAGADRIDRQTSLRLESQGSISFIDGGLFASNTIQDSFAVVNTDGLSHIRVLRENRDADSTDSAGQLLIPDLRSFDINHISIEPTDIPPDVTLAFSSREVRPQDHSGVVVRFPAQISHGALLRLVDEAGTPVAVGSTATLRATGAVVPVGYDGNAYVQRLDAHNDIDVERLDGRRCSAAFDYRPVSGDIPTIGPLSCREQKP